MRTDDHVERRTRGAKGTSALLLLTVVLGVRASWATNVMVRWARSPSPTVAGYRVYERAAGTAYGSPKPGVPQVAADGTLSFVVTGVPTQPAQYFTVTAFAADGTESPISNELAFGSLNPCTLDRCVSLMSCRVTPATNGTSCSDGNPCNGAETCLSGSCVSGTPPSCSDGNACTSDTCDPLRGCVHTPIAACSGCRSNLDCDDGNRCTTDVCSAGTCHHTTLADGTPCSDGNACNGLETCRGGICGAGTAPVCFDGNPCTTDSCSALSGCVHQPVAGCIPCTSDAECDDGDRCTADTCDPFTGCVHRQLSGCPACTGDAQCVDTDPCTLDTCQGGFCEHTPTPEAPGCGVSFDDACAALCSLPECSSPARVPFSVGRFRVSPLSSGTTLRMTGSITPHASIDLATEGVTLALADGSGNLIYRTNVPGSQLQGEAGGSRFAFFALGDAPDTGGIQHLLLRQRGNHWTISVRAVDEQLAQVPDGRIDSVVLLGTQCGSAGTTCMSQSGRSTCRPDRP